MKTITVSEHIDEELIKYLSMLEEEELKKLKDFIVGALHGAGKISLEELKEYTER